MPENLQLDASVIKDERFTFLKKHLDINVEMPTKFEMREKTMLFRLLNAIKCLTTELGTYLLFIFYIKSTVLKF